MTWKSKIWWRIVKKFMFQVCWCVVLYLPFYCHTKFASRKNKFCNTDIIFWKRSWNDPGTENFYTISISSFRSITFHRTYVKKRRIHITAFNSFWSQKVFHTTNLKNANMLAVALSWSYGVIRKSESATFCHLILKLYISALKFD